MAGCWQETARYAHALAAQGLKPGDRLAVQVEKSPEAIILYLAAARAGVVFLPLNTAYTVAELDYFIADAEPALVIVDPARREAIEPIARARGAAPGDPRRPRWRKLHRARPRPEDGIRRCRAGAR